MQNLTSVMEAISGLSNESVFLEKAPALLKELQVGAGEWKNIVKSRLSDLPGSLESNLNEYDTSFWMSISSNRIPVAGGSLDDKFSRDFSLDYNILGTDVCKFSCASFFHFDEDSLAAVATSIYSQVLMVVEGVCEYTEYYLSHDIPESIENSNLMNSLYITNVKHKVAESGEVIIRDRNKSLIMIDTTKKCVLLSITPLHHSALFQLNFNKESGHIDKIIDNDTSASRKRKLLSIIQSYGNVRSLAIAKQLLNDPHHGIRWQALKVLMNIDEKNIEQYLLLGIKDNHNEIRETCNYFLEQYKQNMEAA